MKSLTDAANFLGGKKSGRDERYGLAQFASTRVRVSFHTDDDKGFDGVVDANPDLKKNQPFKIIGFTTTKRFGSNPGTFTITIKSDSGADLLRLWRDPEDVWVRITVIKNGEFHDVMLGVIDTITETKDRAVDGSRSVVYQINGRDFQKCFLKSQTFINIHEHSGDLPAVTIYDAMKEGLNGSPDVVVRALINAWLGNEGVADKQWRWPKSLGGRFFFDALELHFDEDLRGTIYEPALLQPATYQGQGLWQLIEEFSNGLLNELYTELDWDISYADNAITPRLVLRERPFPSIDIGQRKWDSLPTYYLSPTAIHRAQVSKGAPESRFNYWLIDGKGLLGNGLGTLKMIQDAAERGKGAPGSAPIYNMESIRNHGLRRWQNATRYLPFRENMDLLLHSARWLQLIHDWYAVSPYELAGTITTNQIFPFLRIGHRLTEGRMDGSEVTYYIEGVTHSWNYPGAGSSVVNVTRGEYADEPLLDIVYEGLSGEMQALESAVQAAVGLVQEMDLPGEAVPTGSGPQMDRAVGQIDTPERIFLKQRKILENNTAIRRGELTYRDDDVARVRSGDLPDQQVPEHAQALVTPIKGRRKAGVLTQRELESGKRLPTRLTEERQLERSRLPEDDLAIAVAPRTRVRKGRKR